MRLILAIFLLPAVLALNCPYPADIPVEDAATTKYMAAIVYQGAGSEHAFQACNGATLKFVDTDRVSVGDGNEFFDVGSLLVKAGCSFIGFKDPNLSGESMVFSGPNLYTMAPGYDYGIGKGFRSWYTECRMHYMSCSPTDNWHVIEVCDAMDSLTAMKVKFWEFYEASLSVSASTGYNWGSVSTETQSTSETFLVSASAPPKTRVIIEQVKGHCEAGGVDTDMFRVSHQTKDGKIVKSEIVRKLPGQKVLKL